MYVLYNVMVTVFMDSNHILHISNDHVSASPRLWIASYVDSHLLHSTQLGLRLHSEGCDKYYGEG